VKIAEAIVAGEGPRLDFKRDLSSPKSVLKDIVAFANTAGGMVVVGVEDDGSVVGVSDPLREEERLSSMISDGIEPRSCCRRYTRSPMASRSYWSSRSLIILRRFICERRAQSAVYL
jgi:hypothetical protein